MSRASLPVAVHGRGRGNPTLISLEQWYKWHMARQDQTGYTEGRARLVRAQAEEAELDLALKHGTMVLVSEVETRWARMVTNARARLLGLVQRLPPAIRATDYSHRALSAVVKQQMHEVLEELANYDGTRPQSAPVGAPAGENGQRVGGRKPPTKPRGKRGARTVAN